MKTNIFIRQHDDANVYVDGIPFPILRYSNQNIEYQTSLLSEQGEHYLRYQIKEELERVKKDKKISNINKKFLIWENLIAQYQIEIITGVNIYSLIDTINTKYRDAYDYHMSALTKAYYDLMNIGFIDEWGEEVFIDNVDITPIIKYRNENPTLRKNF